MFSFLKPQKTVTVTAHLPTCLTDAQRAARYDGPVQEALTAWGVGAVTGGSSAGEAAGRVTGCTVTMQIKGLDKKLMDRLVPHFESLGAPRGSVFTDEEGKELRSFGSTHVLVLELDMAGLPEAVKAEHKTEELLERINHKISSGGRFMGQRDFDKTTDLYFHCRAVRHVEAALAELLVDHPLCANARVFSPAG
ncbi:hypothetical protein CKO11_03130 [Rhodobacter sp. TJ_12]|uniref:hypothetical protein n=1 Tax=Rhodobacter sp. TJ_12 TaxID=2029399 RepID=UPI001CBAFF4C|nr:hypothetical protein [Rhodobacter sp. TJ_12]MBZ4021457.1 hypothetical protein [Rhodobacter sp. TJ_12]